MAAKRLFIGIPVPPDLQDFISQNFEHLQLMESKSVRWIPKENYHITLYFLGNQSIGETERLITKFPSLIGDVPRFSLLFSHYIFYPRSRPYMVWAKAAENLHYDALQKKLQEAFNPQQQTQKPSIPHITLARFKHPGIAKVIALPKVKKAIKLEVNSVVLWESVLTPEGARYQQIAATPLV